MNIALDTNTYRAFMDGDSKAVNILRHAAKIYLPLPVLAELRYGFLRGTKGKQNENFLNRFLDSPRVHILQADEATTHFFAQLKLQLTRQGTPIPIHDVWIAALVIQHGLTLYTLDGDFNHIGQLPRIS